MKQSLSVKELTFLVIIRELLKLIDPKKIKSNFFAAEANELLNSYSNLLPKLPSKSTKEITSFFAKRLYMKSKKLNNLISNLPKEELASTCEKLAVEFSALAITAGYAQSQEEHAISAVERCSMPSTPCVPLRQSLIGLSNNVSINLHCHTEDFMPSLDQLIQLDELVKSGEVNGTIHSVIEPSLIATWKKD